ncbi:hypothetical protein Tco_1182576 [Tanacetum coccineum]
MQEKLRQRKHKNLGDLHWTTVKNILKYLGNTKDMFLVYGGVVDWKSTNKASSQLHLQKMIIFDAYDASKEAVWVRKFTSRLSVVPIIEEPINMYCDNTIAINIANESRITKEKVHTDDNLVDTFTKALAFPKHSEHTRNIGMLPASSLILGLKSHVKEDTASTNPDWCQLDDLIKMRILGSLCDSLQEQVVTTPGNTKALWDHLKELFHDNKDARI